MIAIERRPMHPGSMPATRDGLPLAHWVLCYAHGGGGDTAAGPIVNGVLHVREGRIALRLIAADSGRLRYACVRDRERECVFVLGDATDTEALVILGVESPTPVVESAKVETELAKVRAALTAPVPGFDPETLDAARQQAATLGLTAEDIAKAKKSELVELFELLRLPVDATERVENLRAQLRGILQPAVA